MSGERAPIGADVKLGAKRMGRSAVRRWGRLTSDLRVLPNVLIVGTQRGGTTSLHRWLMEHPAAFTPVRHKGVHYFDVAYPQGAAWYRGHFPTRTTVQRVADATGGNPIIFETSPYYMFHPAAPARFAADLPGVRVIAVLRDPVERAYSAWAHEKARGFEDLDFAAALDAEESRLAGEESALLSDPGYVSEHHQHHAYLGRGRYLPQLQRLEAALGRDRIAVVDFDQLIVEPESVQAALLAFLGIPDDSSHPLPHVNARPRQGMDPVLRRRLRKRYADEDEALVAWLGWTPRWLLDH